MKKVIVALALIVALGVAVGHPLAKKLEAGTTTVSVSSDPGSGGGTTT